MKHELLQKFDLICLYECDFKHRPDLCGSEGLPCAFNRATEGNRVAQRRVVKIQRTCGFPDIDPFYGPRQKSE